MLTRTPSGSGMRLMSRIVATSRGRSRRRSRHRRFSGRSRDDRFRGRDDRHCRRRWRPAQVRERRRAVEQPRGKPRKAPEPC